MTNGGFPGSNHLKYLLKWLKEGGAIRPLPSQCMVLVTEAARFYEMVEIKLRKKRFRQKNGFFFLPFPSISIIEDYAYTAQLITAHDISIPSLVTFN